MTYEETPIKKSSGRDNKAMAVKLAAQLNTGTLIWLLIKRHKLGLVMAWAIVMTSLYVFPAWPGLLMSLAGK